MNLYQEESNELLKFALDSAVLNNMHKLNPDKTVTSVELIITPECNLKCEYCYIRKHRDQLYPNSIINHDTIKRNAISVLNWLKDNQYYPAKLDLYSGEIWNQEFGYEILEIVFNFLSKHKITTGVVIPTNMTFLREKLYEDKMQEYINKFRSIGIPLQLSASIDGKVIDDKFRTYKNSELTRTDDFYDTVFAFCKRNNFGFHPMMFSKSAKYWKENYLWFEEMKRKYDITRDIMILEVRDNDWTDEDIDEYIKFLDWLFDYKFSEDYPSLFIKYAFDDHVSYSPLVLYQESNYISCSIQHTLMVRLGDLAIVPCHRTSYDKFIYGKFVTTEDGIITRIESNNAELALTIYSMNPSVAYPKCDICKYNSVCIKQCLGSACETNKDLFAPCSNVCKLLTTKIKYLIKKYKDTGIIDALGSSVDMNSYQMYLTYMDIIEKGGLEE